jgi:uncharacterized protein YbjT (DUF2867 family)
VRVLVAGGTGRLGGQVVRRLQRGGVQTRVLTRDATRAAVLAAAGSEVATGDVRLPSSLPAALIDVDVVVSAVHGLLGPRGESPETVDRAGNIALFEAAHAAGADLVMVSVVGAAADSPFELFRAKHAAEQHLTQSGIGWTIVRAPAFLETWLDILRTTAARSGRPTVLGRGDNPIDFASVAAVVEAVTDAVLDRGRRGRVVEVPSEVRTLNDLADVVASETGSSRATRHVPRPALRVVGVVGRLVKPDVGRLARTALAMDTSPRATLHQH